MKTRYLVLIILWVAFISADCALYTEVVFRCGRQGWKTVLIPGSGFYLAWKHRNN